MERTEVSMWFRRFWILPVRLYQKMLSRFLGNQCRFTPSCSEYACEAILRKGVVRGTMLAVWRILRCNPFCKGGFDPVPSDGPAGAESSDPIPAAPDSAMTAQGGTPLTRSSIRPISGN